MKKNSKSSKRILIVTERFYPEEFRINDLALEWKNRGFDVKVLTQFPSYPFGRIFDGYKNRFFKKDTWNGIEIFRILSVTGYRDSLFKKLLQYFNYAVLGSIFAIYLGKKCDSVFVYHLGPLTDAMPAVVIKKLFRKKVTIWTTDIWPDAIYAYGFKRTKLREFFLDGFIKFIYRNCTNVLISSTGFTKRLKKYVQGKEIKYIPHWADASVEPNPEDQKTDFSLSDDEKFHFTFAGNIGKVQNLENVILGFSKTKNINKMQLNIIGDGSHLGYLKTLTEKKSISNVTFWGRIPAKNMRKYYDSTNVLLIPLSSDPLLELTIPGKFQTCLSLGKPIYSVMNGAVKEMVQDYKLGAFSNPDSTDDIAKGFDNLFETKSEELSQYGQNCVNLCKNEFNRETIFSEITSYVSIEGRV